MEKNVSFVEGLVNTENIQSILAKKVNKDPPDFTVPQGPPQQSGHH